MGLLPAPLKATRQQFEEKIAQRGADVVEKFSDMQDDLDRERRTMTRLWAKREEQIKGVIESTAGMYGDLQGIAGKTLKEIDGLEFRLLDAPRAETEVGEA
jgi:hypothetical protein